MIEKTVKKIEETVTQAPSLSPEKRKQLLELLEELQTEIAKLSETHQESALDIADRTRTSTEAATRTDPDGDRLAAATEELKASVGKFEVSHPGLVAVVNSFCNALADLGI